MLTSWVPVEQVIERYELPARITANQNLLLLDIEPSWKADIVATLGVPLEYTHAVIKVPLQPAGSHCIMAYKFTYGFAHSTD
jgi:sulfite reductase beta subunit-like hemoprotein